MNLVAPIIAALSIAPPALANQRGVTNLVHDVALDNVESWDFQGSNNNTILTLDIGNNTVTSIGWDLTIETVGESWRSEPSFRFTDTEGNLFFTVTPGFGDDSPGTTMYSSLTLIPYGLLDLTDIGLSNFQPAGGLLMIEIFESYDDVTDAVDAYINGKLRIGLDGILVPPAPGTLALFGVAGVAALRRR